MRPPLPDLVETAAGPARVLLVDDRLVVVDKPSGVLSVPGIGPEKQDCLVARVAAAIPGARIVHRLDRDTSGVIILARDAAAHRELSRQFQDREVRKAYVAVVDGVVEADSGTIDLPMRKDLDDAPRQIIDHEHGRHAITHWSVLERGADRTRLDLRPVTGRSHQLRLHMKVIGHPILGDDLYADPTARAKADRLLLHALWLWFVHPETAAPVTVEAPAPF
ncbi:MAG: RluA family pseudouridine synthase [Phycisphaerales bacterium]|nr:RluA family pseudouridine synthase [Phycisphaerales bacterium]